MTNDLSHEFHPVPKPTAKSTKSSVNSTVKSIKPGKKTKEWNSEREIVKKNSKKRAS